MPGRTKAIEDATALRHRSERLERHRWWIAGVASMLIPGLGQVYNRRLARGTWLFLAMLILPLVLLVWVLVRGWLYLWLAVPLLTLLGLHILIITEAMVTGRRLTRDGGRPPHAEPGQGRADARGGVSGGSGRRRSLLARASLYVLFSVVVVVSFQAVQSLAFERAFAVTTITTAQPDLGLDAGDVVLINRLAFGPAASLRWRTPRSEQVVVYRDEGGVGRLGRCVAVAGQTVAISAGVLSIDGHPMRTLRPRGFSATTTTPIPDLGPQLIAPESCCVLSAPLEAEPGTPVRVDMVPFTRLIGEAMVIVWSSDPRSGRVRAERLGLPIF
jgi:hypothetical protein